MRWRYIMSKSSKRRDCPALAKVITAAECGAGRHGSIACPPDCAFNPFAPATYEQLLDIETRLDRRTVDALVGEVGEAHFQAVVVAGDRVGGEVGRNTAIVRELFFRRDAQGHSFADRWIGAGAPGLTNDERVFLAGKARMRPALLEVQEVRADGLLTMLDLLDPTAPPVQVLDRSSWARAVRYEVLFVWLYPLPHYCRVSGSGVRWPEWSGLDLAEVEQLHEIMRHAGGIEADASLAEKREWLAFHFEEVSEIVFEVSDVRRRDALEVMDAQWGWREYRLEAAVLEKLRQQMTDRRPQVRAVELEEEDIQAGFDSIWDWYDSTDRSTSATARPVLGHVLMGGGVMRLRAMGSARLTRLQTEVLALLGRPSLQPDRELMQDLGRQEASKIPGSDFARAPPRLREQPERFELRSFTLESEGSGKSEMKLAGERIEAMQRQWLDISIPTLANQTPREAVKDTAGRKKVLRLMKERIRVEDRDRLLGQLEYQAAHDLVQELGLTELDGPPPPARPCPEEWLEDAKRSGSSGAAAPPPAPVWLGRKLTKDEVFARLDALDVVFPSDLDLVEAWARACPVLAQMIVQETDYLPVEDASEIDIVLANVWALLGGVRVSGALRLDPERIRLQYGEADRRLSDVVEPKPDDSPLLGLCASQQELAFSVLAELAHRLKEQERPDEKVQELFVRSLVWLHATIAELDSAIGRQQ
jgi:hypothetical protein